MDFRVANNFSEGLEGRATRLLDALVAVGEDGGELGDDGRERGRELLGLTEGHRAEKLNRSALGT